MTTRAVADVHRQRTGGNMRPLPWNILIPLVVGISISLMGVIVSFYGFSYGTQTTYAVVPTALLAGLMMFQATRETNQRAFVWIGLVLMAISYQCAPTLCAGLVQQVKSNAAYAVGEERLPLAFYGLSYLPFLLTVACASSWLARRNAATFAIPMRQFVTILTVALFAVSWTHLKACLPVAAINLFLFSFYAVLFRDRRFAIPAVAAATVAVGTWIPFVNAMQIAAVPNFSIIASLSIFATLLAAFPQIDQLINRLPQPSAAWRKVFTRRDGSPIQICFTTSNLLVLGLSPLWILWVALNLSFLYSTGQIGNSSGLVHAIGLVPLVALTINLAILTVRSRVMYYSLGMWGMLAVSAIAAALYLRVPGSELATGATITCAIINLMALAPFRTKHGLTSAVYLEPFAESKEPHDSPSLLTVFLLPLQMVSGLGLMGLIASVHIPTILVSNVFLTPLFVPLGAIAAMVWLVAIRLIYKGQWAGIAAAVAFPLLSSAMVITTTEYSISYATLPLIWSVAAVVTSVIAWRSTSKNAVTVQGIALSWVVVSAGLSLSSFEMVARLTAIVSLTTLAVTEMRRYGRNSWTALAIAANVQILMLVVGLSGMTSWLDLIHNSNLCLNTLPALAATLVLSLAVWDIRRISFEANTRIVCQYVLRTLFLAATLECFLLPAADATQTCVLLLSLALACVVEFIEAVRKQQAGHIWTGFAMLALALAWLISQGQVVVGAGATQVALLATTIASLLFAKLARSHTALGFAAPRLSRLD